MPEKCTGSPPEPHQIFYLQSSVGTEHVHRVRWECELVQRTLEGTRVHGHTGVACVLC